MKETRTKILCEGAIMVALAQILGYIKLYRLPQGGSITLAMLPIFIYAKRRGLKYGLLSSFALALLQLVLDGAYTWGWQSILLDYIFAYGILGIAGIFKNSKNGLYYGILLGGGSRLLLHVISGYLFVRNNTGFSIYGVNSSSPWIYSIIYNASYMVPSIAAILLVCFFLKKPLNRYLS